MLETYEKWQICSMHCILCITMPVCIMQESKLLQNSAFVLCDSVSDSCIHCIHTIDNDFAIVSFARTNRHSIFPQFELNFIVSLDLVRFASLNWVISSSLFLNPYRGKWQNPTIANSHYLLFSFFHCRFITCSTGACL